jgi:hypothetical protein
MSRLIKSDQAGCAEQEACQYLVDVSFLTKSSPASSWSPTPKRATAMPSAVLRFITALIYHPSIEAVRSF